MDDYYTQPATYNSALEHIQKASENQQFKTRKIIQNSLVISFSIMGFFVGLFVMLQLDIGYILIPLGFIAFIELLLILIVRTNSKQKMINTIINDEIVQIYNSSNGTTYSYESKPKIPKTFNVDMGMFTRSAAVSTVFAIKDTTSTFPFELYRCTLMTSNGKSSTVHFTGMYIRFFIPNIPRQQLLSRGKPHASGIKMVQVEGYEERLFTPLDSPETRINPILYGIFQDLPNKFDLKAYHVGSNATEVHVAFTPKRREKLPEEFTYQTIQEFSEPLMSYLTYVDEVRIQLAELAI